jgi:hypothetical protein
VTLTVRADAVRVMRTTALLANGADAVAIMMSAEFVISHAEILPLILLLSLITATSQVGLRYLLPDRHDACAGGTSIKRPQPREWHPAMAQSTIRDAGR